MVVNTVKEKLDDTDYATTRYRVFSCATVSLPSVSLGVLTTIVLGKLLKVCCFRNGSSQLAANVLFGEIEFLLNLWKTSSMLFTFHFLSV